MSDFPCHRTLFLGTTDAHQLIHCPLARRSQAWRRTWKKRCCVGRRPQRGHAGPSGAARSRARVRGAAPMMPLADVTSSTASDAATHLGSGPGRKPFTAGFRHAAAVGYRFGMGCRWRWSASLCSTPHASKGIGPVLPTLPYPRQACEIVRWVEQGVGQETGPTLLQVSALVTRHRCMAAIVLPW